MNNDGTEGRSIFIFFFFICNININLEIKTTKLSYILLNLFKLLRLCMHPVLLNELKWIHKKCYSIWCVICFITTTPITYFFSWKSHHIADFNRKSNNLIFILIIIIILKIYIWARGKCVKKWIIFFEKQF